LVYAFFDFDGTITKKDSFIDFLKYTNSPFKFWFNFILLSPVLVLFKLRLISNERAKQIVLSMFFKGENIVDFKKKAYNYAVNQLPKTVKKNAMDKILWHKQQNHRVVVVSASLKCWLSPWCEQNEIELIATELEERDGFLTGKLATKNCFGKEKVKRIKEKYSLNENDIIYAYGDSVGDREMLQLATYPNYRVF
jgi:HAD superfamily hydrolase (TIGR01490 family)